MQTQELEAIIRRYAEGDRAPGLVALLNAAAWEGFHDPWEPRPDFAPPEVPEEPLGLATRVQDGADPVDAPQSWRSVLGMVTAYLEVHHWPAAPAPEGGLTATPAFQGMQGRDLTLSLQVQGGPARDLRLSLGSSWAVPVEARPAALRFCEQWNRDQHAVSARLQYPVLVASTLELRASLPLGPRMSMKVLVAFLDAALKDARDFWAHVRQEAPRWSDDRG